MKPITVFQADDGSRWDREKDALERDAMHREAEAAESPLGERPNLGSDEYVQHASKAIDAAHKSYIDLAVKYFGTTNPRVVDDSGNPVYSLMYRLRCIDALAREWQQVYYANHTPKNPKLKEKR